MKQLAFLIGTATILSLALGSQSDKSTDKSGVQKFRADTTTIKDVVKKYAESINRADTELGSKLFRHTKEVSFIHPLGHAKGWNEIKKTIYQ